MQIVGNNDNLDRKLRQVIGSVEARRIQEPDVLLKTRLEHLGQLLLIAADMAAEIENGYSSSEHHDGSTASSENDGTAMIRQLRPSANKDG